MRAAVLAALLSVLPPLALAEVCRPSASAASGVCEEVQRETGASLELLQHRADRAQPEKAAGEKQAAKQEAQLAMKQDAQLAAKQDAKVATKQDAQLAAKQDAKGDAKLAAKQDAKADSKQGAEQEAKDAQDPARLRSLLERQMQRKILRGEFDPLGDLTNAARAGIQRGEDAVQEAMDTTALAGVTSVINSTIVMLTEKAQYLLYSCSKYQDDLLSSVRAAPDKLAQLLSEVNATLDPLVDRWSTISEALSAAGPPLDTAMRTFGLDPPIMAGVEYMAETVTTLVSSMHSSVELLALANATNVTEQDKTLLLISQTVQAGLSTANAFERSVNTFLQGVIAQVGKKLKVDVKAVRPEDKNNGEIYDTLQALMQGSEDLASKLEADLDILFNGTYVAAEEAVHPELYRSAAAGFWRHGVVAVAMACLGAHWL